MKIRNPFRRNHLSLLIEATKAPTNRMMTLAAPVDLAAAATGEDGKTDPSKPRKFSMVAYTGGLMRLAGWYSPVVVDLKGLKFSTPMTMLGNHQNDPDWVAGQAQSVEIVENRLEISGEVFPKTPPR